MQTTRNKITTLLTALFLTTGVVGAAPALDAPEACQFRAPTPESYTWDFSSEATELFEQVEVRAQRIQAFTSELDAFTRTSELPSWESHALELQWIRNELNRMGADVCRLARIQHVVDSAQKPVIARIQLRATNLEELLETSLAQFNERPETEKILPDYAERIDRMYREAVELEDAAEALDSRESAD